MLKPFLAVLFAVFLSVAAFLSIVTACRATAVMPGVK